MGRIGKSHEPESIDTVASSLRRGRMTYHLPVVRATTREQPLCWFGWLPLPEVGRDLDRRTFMEAMESLGLASALDQRAVEDATRWLRQQEDVDRLSIQISAGSLADEEFPRRLVAALAAEGVHASRFCFELQVHAALDNLSGATRFVKAMRSVGALITLRDGVPGNPVLGLYGPLGLVNHLRIHERWVREAPTCASHRETLESIVDYAKRLGLTVIADGVDNSAQRELVSLLGVDFFEGEVSGTHTSRAVSEGGNAPILAAIGG